MPSAPHRTAQHNTAQHSHHPASIVSGTTLALALPLAIELAQASLVCWHRDVCRKWKFSRCTIRIQKAKSNIRRHRYRSAASIRPCCGCGPTANCYRNRGSPSDHARQLMVSVVIYVQQYATGAVKRRSFDAEKSALSFSEPQSSVIEMRTERMQGVSQFQIIH